MTVVRGRFVPQHQEPDLCTRCGISLGDEPEDAGGGLDSIDAPFAPGAHRLDIGDVQPETAEREYCADCDYPELRLAEHGRGILRAPAPAFLAAAA
ncbi:hypothetical protein [Brevibacterium album]|uniref:hypothetical protein n=1 Tax=Brevibacterium album TaxID=417948 RepID=UPI00041F3DC3|nr:hypothetical protein [Brevibacterium album]